MNKKLKEVQKKNLELFKERMYELASSQGKFKAMLRCTSKTQVKRLLGVLK